MKPIGLYANISLENVAGTVYAVPATFSVKYLHRKPIGFILMTNLLPKKY